MQKKKIYINYGHINNYIKSLFFFFWIKYYNLAQLALKMDTKQ